MKWTDEENRLVFIEVERIALLGSPYRASVHNLKELLPHRKRSVIIAKLQRERKKYVDRRSK